MINALFRRKHTQDAKMATLSRGKTNMGGLSSVVPILALRDVDSLRKSFGQENTRDYAF